MSFNELKINIDDGVVDKTRWNSLIDKITAHQVAHVPLEGNAHLKNGLSISGVAVGGNAINHDSPKMNYPWAYETVGVTQQGFNLRLQSPNHIFFHTGMDANGENNYEKVGLSINKTGKVKANHMQPNYLEPGIKDTTRGYEYIRFGTPDLYFGGIMHNKTNAGFGNGDDFVFFSYDNRNINIRPGGTGNTYFSRGNVGIGVTTPNTKLHIKTSSHGDAIRVEGGGRDLYIQSDEIYSSNHALHINTNSNQNLLLVKGGGRVGIGTTTPKQELHIYRDYTNVNTNVDIRLEREPGGTLDIFTGKNSCGLWSSSKKTMKFGTNGQERLSIDGYGNIKVGTHTPIIIHRFEDIGDNVTFNTKYSSFYWNAAIVGFVARDGDINERGSGDIINLRMHNKRGEWHIVADFHTHDIHENWSVDVMFIRKEISESK